jgi:POTRA domain-containing FtsQ-type protein
VRAGCRTTVRLRRPERRRRNRRLVAVVVLVGLAAYGVSRAARPAEERLGRLSPFQARRIEVLGNRYLTADEVRAAMPVAEGANLLLLKPRDVEAALRLHPRIASVRVTRAPGTLVVQVRERDAFVLLNAGALLEVDSSGTILPRLRSGLVPDRPVVSGLAIPTRRPGARVMTAAFRDVLRLVADLGAPDVRLVDDVSEIVALDARRVVLRTDPDEIPILVDPTRTTPASLRALAATLRDLRSRPRRVLGVDARYRGQVVVRCAPDSMGVTAREPREKV